MISNEASLKMVVAIPTTKSELDDYIQYPEKRDLLSAQNITYQRYEREIIIPFSRVIQTWENLGIKIYTGATLNVLYDALQDDQTTCLCLVSHWVLNPQRIEFFNGLIPIEEVASVFPIEWDGVLDLCICQSLELAKLVSNRCIKATVKKTSSKEKNKEMATPAVWFYIYTLAFRLVREHKISYLEALDVAIHLFHGNEHSFLSR